MTPRYVPQHHNLCQCELCRMDNAIGGERPSHEDKARAARWMDDHGKPCERDLERTPNPGEERGSVSRMVGRTVRFQFSHKQPDLTDYQSPWNHASEANCLMVDRGAVLLAIGGRPRWWPLRMFAWIETIEEPQS